MAKYFSGKYVGSRSRSVILCVILLILAALLLFIGASGKVIAENLLLPIFGEIEPIFTPLPEGYTSCRITLPRLDVYTLVLYSSDSSRDASLAAERIRQRGGAGYVFKEGNYMVIASGYQSLADARAVANKQGEEYLPEVFLLSSGSVSFEVKCSEKDALSMKDACETYSGERMSIIKESMELERGNIGQSEVKMRYLNRAADAKRMVERLEDVPSGKDDELITRLLTLYRNAETRFREIYSKNYEYSIDFFADIRYNYIEMTVEYQNAVQNLT